MRFARALHVPEAEVDVPVVLHRVEREAAGMRLRADRADPLRPEADVLRVELQELGRARERDVDVLDHRLRMQAEDALDFAGDADAAIPAHDLGVGARAQPLSPIEAADERVLREHVLRAPEPVGVPAPDVVAHRQVVLALFADRAVVDALVGVIAGVRRGGGEAPERQVHLARREYCAVDEVGVLRAQARAELGEKEARVAERRVPEMHVRLHRYRARLHAQRIAERAVGVGKAEKQIGVLVGRGAGDHASVAEDDVELEHRVVHEAIAVRGRLDADAGDGAAERDGLQLRHDRGHHAVGEALAREILVGNHAFGLDSVGADREHLVELAHVKPPARRRGAVAEEVGGLLREPDGRRFSAPGGPKPRGQGFFFLRVLPERAARQVRRGARASSGSSMP